MQPFGYAGVRAFMEGRYSEDQPRDEKGRFGSGEMLESEKDHYEAMHFAAAHAHKQVATKEAHAGHGDAAVAHNMASEAHYKAADKAVNGTHQDYKAAAAKAAKASDHALNVTTDAYVNGKKA